MNLEIQSMWSPDLDPPSSGVPPDRTDFDVLVQISIGDSGAEGSEVFACRVCSAAKVASVEAGQFISHTLVLEKFMWSDVENRIQKLLMHTTLCKDWSCVIKSLSPYLEYSDQW